MAAKKVGPLPTWGWVAVIVGGVLLALIARSRGSSQVAGQIATAAPLPAASSTGGSVGANTAPAPSGLDPNLEALILGLSQIYAAGAASVPAGAGGSSNGAGSTATLGRACGQSVPKGQPGNNCPVGYRCHHGRCEAMPTTDAGTTTTTSTGG